MNIYNAFLIHEGFKKEADARKMSEVLKKSDFCKVERIIEFIEEKGEITSKEAERITGKSAATVRRYLKMLVETGYVEAEGNTNNSIYKAH